MNGRLLRFGEWLDIAGVLAVQYTTARMAQRQYKSLPVLQRQPQPSVIGVSTDGSQVEALPVSVIIPARNEEKNLPILLASLQAQRPAPAEIVLVDDRSEDRTAAMAIEAGVRSIRSSGPPLGWTGKTFACYLGAEAAKSPWLLFLDADTCLEPQTIGVALAYVQEHDLDGVSLFLQQRCESLWERLLLPTAYAHYFAGVRGETPLANGQFILLSREAYGRCGGHEGIAGSIIDDVALANACRRAGVRLALARGEALASVRMYTGFGSIWMGFSKNSFRFLASNPRGGIWTAASTSADTAVIYLIWRAWRRGGLGRWLAGIVSYGVGIWGMSYWQRLFRAGRWGVFLHPLSACIVQAIALSSTLQVVLRKGVVWKGRRY